MDEETVMQVETRESNPVRNEYTTYVENPTPVHNRGEFYHVDSYVNYTKTVINSPRGVMDGEMWMREHSESLLERGFETTTSTSINPNANNVIYTVKGVKNNYSTSLIAPEVL